MSVASVVDVFVEPCSCAQDGLVLRFIRVSDEQRSVQAVRYTSEGGVAGVWRVTAALDVEAKEREPARGWMVERGEGVALLVEGGTHGLVLELDGDEAQREIVRLPCLVIASDALVR